MVAFANADGGELFVGVEDNHSVTGIPYDQNKLSYLQTAAETYVMKDTPLPLKKAAIIDYNGLKVAYFSVEKGSKYVHLTAKGECFQRRDRDSVPTSSESIRFIREEAVSREYDRQFVEIAQVTDLDIDLVKSVAHQVSKTISPENFLQYLELAEFDGNRLRLRKAALLLFAKNPGKWHPRLQVRILKVRGTEEKTGEEFNVEEIEEVSGNIFSLIERSWEALKPNLTETRFSKDGLFKTQIIYPELACRETLINAITHRDYSIEGRGIEVRVFDDRLEILSPGKLLSSITIKDLEDLKGVHQSRNTYVARVLREFGYIRELGEGIRRIFELMQNNDLVKPKIESPNKSFIITLFYKFIYSKEEKNRLKNFESFNLSREQKTVVRLGINGRLVSAKEVWEQVGIVSEEYYRLLIESLRNLGILRNSLTQTQVSSQKSTYGNSRKAVPRYKIILPGQEVSTVKTIEDTSDQAKIYVSNLPSSVRVEELEQIFSQFGEVVDISIPKNHQTGETKGYCFIEFDKKESVRKVLQNRQPLYLSNRQIYIQDFQR
ncbi:MAG: ATP-binding protein [Saprospiraceae bacterium]|nr:ATP-binding protein [Saprospiraceae bacterium]